MRRFPAFLIQNGAPLVFMGFSALQYALVSLFIGVSKIRKKADKSRCGITGESGLKVLILAHPKIESCRNAKNTRVSETQKNRFSWAFESISKKGELFSNSIWEKSSSKIRRDRSWSVCPLFLSWILRWSSLQMPYRSPWTYFYSSHPNTDRVHDGAVWETKW